MNAIVFDVVTGEIVALLTGAAPLADELPSGTAWMEGDANQNDHYIDVVANQVANKTALNLIPDKLTILPDSVDFSTINAIPPGVSVTWPDNTTELVTDGVVEFATTQPGTYQLTFTAVEYLTEVIEIETSI